MKRSLEGRRAVFDFRGRKRALTPTQAEIDRNPPVRHPIVRTHPRTGRTCLYVMRDDCTGIEGIGPDEAEALIAALADHIIKPAFVYRHQWRPGDVLMCDNCMVQHRAIQDYDMPQRRLMHRTTMGGAVPAKQPRVSGPPTRRWCDRGLRAASPCDSTPKPQRGRAATRCACSSGAVCGAIMTACCSASAATRRPSVKPAARVLSNCT